MKRNPRPVTVIAFTLVIGVIVGYALARSRSANAEAGENAVIRERWMRAKTADTPLTRSSDEVASELFGDDEDE